MNGGSKLEMKIREWVTGLQAVALILHDRGILYHELEIPTGHWEKEI